MLSIEAYDQLMTGLLRPALRLRQHWVTKRRREGEPKS
jgi:hypothetical protein